MSLIETNLLALIGTTALVLIGIAISRGAKNEEEE